jgi:hypothetical protein
MRHEVWKRPITRRPGKYHKVWSLRPDNSLVGARCSSTGDFLEMHSETIIVWSGDTRHDDRLCRRCR